MREFIKKIVIKSEVAQASIELVGMVVVASLVVVVLISGASGWGNSLVCKISSAISGEVSACSVQAAPVDKMLPDNIVTGEESVSTDYGFGAKLPVGVAEFEAGGGSAKTLKNKKYADGTQKLVSTWRGKGHFDASFGHKESGGGAKVEAKAGIDVNGYYEKIKVYDCKELNLSVCSKQSDAALAAAKRNNDISNLAPLNYNDPNTHKKVEPDEIWKKFGGSVDLHAGLGAGLDDEIAKLNAETKFKFVGEGTYAYEEKSGETKTNIKIGYDASSKAEAGLGLSTKDDNSDLLMFAEAELGASAKFVDGGSAEIETATDGNGEVSSFTIITERTVEAVAEAHASAGTSLADGLQYSNGKSSDLNLRSSSVSAEAGKKMTIVTTATVKLDDIQDVAVRESLRKELGNALGGKHPINTAIAVYKGGIFKTRPGDDNRLGQAFHDVGTVSVQTFDVKDTKVEGGFDLYLFNHTANFSSSDKSSQDYSYLASPDRTGERHLKKYDASGAGVAGKP